MSARHPHKCTPLTVLLLLTLALTPWLSFWTTPLLAQTAAGKTVVLCTLQGLKTVRLDASDTIINDKLANDLHCPALHLAKLFSQSAPPDLPGLDVPFWTQPEPPPFRHYAHTVPHLSVYSGRAPPFLQQA